VHSGVFLGGYVLVIDGKDKLDEIILKHKIKRHISELKGNELRFRNGIEFAQAVIDDIDTPWFAFEAFAWDKAIVAIKILWAAIYDSGLNVTFRNNYANDVADYRQLFLDIKDEITEEVTIALYTSMRSNKGEEFVNILDINIRRLINTRRTLLAQMCIDASKIISNGALKKFINNNGSDFVKLKSVAYECFVEIAKEAAKWHMVNDREPVIVHDRTDRFRNMYNSRMFGGVFVSGEKSVPLPRISYVDSKDHNIIQLCDLLLWLSQYCILHNRTKDLSKLYRGLKWVFKVQGPFSIENWRREFPCGSYHTLFTSYDSR